jgi:hypothetical protein
VDAPLGGCGVNVCLTQRSGEVELTVRAQCDHLASPGVTFDNQESRSQPEKAHLTDV